MGWIVLLVILGAIATILLLSLWVIGPTEMGIFTFLGKIVKVRTESGPCFGRPRPLGKMIRFPTMQMKLEYEVPKPITKKGRYYPTFQLIKKEIEELKSEIKKETDNKERQEFQKKLKEFEEKLDEMKKGRYEKEFEECESVEVDKVGVAVYLKYSKSEENLKKALEILGGPKSEEELKKYYEEFVTGSLREATGVVEWKVLVENREHINGELKERFSDENSPFIVAGFNPDDLYVTLTLVDLPDTLARLLSLPQEESLKAEAADFQAKQRARETVGAVIEMVREETNLAKGEIQKQIREKPEEFIKKYEKILEKNWDIIHRRMGIDGRAYLDIRTQNPLLDIVTLIKKGLPGGREEEKEPKGKEEKADRWPALEEERRKSEEELKKLKK